MKRRPIICVLSVIVLLLIISTMFSPAGVTSRQYAKHAVTTRTARKSGNHTRSLSNRDGQQQQPESTSRGTMNELAELVLSDWDPNKGAHAPESHFAIGSNRFALAPPQEPDVITPQVVQMVGPISQDQDLRTLPYIPPNKEEEEWRLTRYPPSQTKARAESDPVQAVRQPAQPAAMPTPSLTFGGINSVTSGCGCLPPDTDGDVGPNHYIQAVNSSFQVFNKSGGTLAGPTTYNSFFSAMGVGTPCGNSQNQGDPIVFYDHMADRWVISDLAFATFPGTSFYQCVGVSQTGDPVAGGWWLYALQVDPANPTFLGDYPKFGVWPDAYYLSVNMFSNPTTFTGVRVFALPRSTMINGTGVPNPGAVAFTITPANLGDIYSLVPATFRSGSPPPAGTPEYFMAINSSATAGTLENQVFTWRFHTDFATPANSTFGVGAGHTPDGATAVNNFVDAFTGLPFIVPQQGTTVPLDALGDRLMYPLVYQKLNVVESLYVSHTVNNNQGGTGPTAIRWYQFDVTGSTIPAAPVQQQTFNNGADGLWRFMPSLTVDGQGNLVVGYSESSSSTEPAIAYAGRLATDPANTLAQGEAVLIAGGGHQTFGTGRWGDYSGTSIDPTDSCTFWHTNEYYSATSDKAWNTRIGKFGFPGCSVPAAAAISGRVLYADTVTPGKNVTMTLTGPQTTATDANGDYAFAGVPPGNDYTVTPSKTGGVNGLESLDASDTARYVAGLALPSGNQRIAADADGDGILTSFDASLIARFVVGLPGAGIVGTWKFAPASRFYQGLSGNQSSQNFTAILVGDTGGNWVPALASGDSVGSSNPDRLAAPSSLNSAAIVSVSIPNVAVPVGSSVTIPINVADLTGLGVRAYDLQVTFNPAVAQPQATPFDNAGTLSSGMSVTPNATNAGHLIISAFQASDLSGSGTLVKIRFTVVGSLGQSTPLTFEDYTDPNTLVHPGFRFNAGTPQASTSNGSLTVNGPTAAFGDFAGCILDDNGDPVEGAAVRMSGMHNRLTVTDANGNYHFDNVETTGFYTVTPSRANFTFSPSQRSFSQLGNHTDAPFNALPANCGLNPLDTTEYFVRQQYVDFLSREPDESGFGFWVNNIESCGTDQDCRATKRTDTSAAFFLSTEFQQTGYLVYRIYQAAYGDMPNAPVPLRLSEFIPDSQAIGQGVIVNQSGWEQVLENNKQALVAEFVQRSRFTSAYPTTMTPSEIVDRLFTNAGVTPSDSERAAAINEFGSATTSTDVAARSKALRRIAENSTLTRQEFNAAFVLMQYFGYLGRDPDTGPDTDFSGYNFWLTKLDNFNGNFQQAEMVKAFLVSGEYQRRFSPVVTHSNRDGASLTMFNTTKSYE